MFVVSKSRGSLLGNEIFWLSLFWGLSIGTFWVGDVKYASYGFSVYFIIFFTLCLSAFIIGRRIGLKSTVRVFDKSSDTIVFKKFTWLGIFGVILYLYDSIRLNGFGFLELEIGGRKELELSIIGTFGALLLPITLLQGLAMFAKELINKNKFSFKACFILLLFALPSTMTGGRESILYCVIGIISLYGFKFSLNRKVILSPKRENKGKKYYINKALAITIISLILWGVFEISTSRFSSGVISHFIYTNDVPNSVVEEGDSWGDFGFLYYNILSYFGHQIPFLDFTLKEYDGPYMWGFFEFNIFARRLGIDYTLVFERLERLQEQHNAQSFRGGWNTILGSFICDFGRIGTIIACYFCGLVLGKIRKKINGSLDIRYSVLVALLCLSAFSTVQLGPFFQTLIWSTYLWWYMIYHKYELKKI